MSEEKPYGYRVTYERNGPRGPEIAPKFRSKGSEARARRAALFKTCYLRVIELEPFTREQWLRCFGEGPM